MTDPSHSPSNEVARKPSVKATTWKSGTMDAQSESFDLKIRVSWIYKNRRRMAQSVPLSSASKRQRLCRLCKSSEIDSHHRRSSLSSRMGWECMMSSVPRSGLILRKDHSSSSARRHMVSHRARKAGRRIIDRSLDRGTSNGESYPIQGKRWIWNPGCGENRCLPSLSSLLLPPPPYLLDRLPRVASISNLSQTPLPLSFPSLSSHPHSSRCPTYIINYSSNLLSTRSSTP